MSTHITVLHIIIGIGKQVRKQVLRTVFSGLLGGIQPHRNSYEIRFNAGRLHMDFIRTGYTRPPETPATDGF